MSQGSQVGVTASHPIPGKALLFGEYGLLVGGPAVVAILPKYRFQLEFLSQKSDEERCQYRAESAFFEEDVVLTAHDMQTGPNPRWTDEARNLYCYLSCYTNELRGRSLTIRVTESFSPALGFGSSSALQAAVHLYFASLDNDWNLRESQLDQKFWTSVYTTLQRLQGRGSGYDVAVQIIAALQSRTERISLHSFRNRSFHLNAQKNGFTPAIVNLNVDTTELRKLGCFVETGVRSDTRQVLSRTSQSHFTPKFYAQQSELAEAFIQDPSFNNASQLCHVAAELACEFHLLPQCDEVQRFVALCRKESIPWKTMGAGFGDCLWVLADRTTIEALLRSHKLSRLTVRTSFEDC